MCIFDRNKKVTFSRYVRIIKDCLPNGIPIKKYAFKSFNASVLYLVRKITTNSRISPIKVVIHTKILNINLKIYIFQGLF